MIPLVKRSDMTVCNNGALQAKGFIRRCTILQPSCSALERGVPDHTKPRNFCDIEDVPLLGLESPSGEENIGIGWADDRVPKQVTILYLAKGTPEVGTKWLHGVLLLEEVQGRGYQRVGMGFISLAPEDYDDNRATAVIQAISIV